MLKRSKKILLEGTLAEFKNYPRGAEGREYVLMNIEEKGPDGSYAFYEKDEKGDIIPVSYKGTEGYDAADFTFILFKDPEFKRIILANFNTNPKGGITTKEADAITSIRQLFKGNTALVTTEDLALLKNVKTIPLTAFLNCTNLLTAIIPEQITSLENDPFDKCLNLKVLKTYSDAQLPLLSASFGLINLDSIEFYGTKTFSFGIRLNGVGSDTQSAFINDSVKEIVHHTFGDCVSLTEINIPNSVTKIGAYAFRDCTSLTSINIPESVIEIGVLAFNGCSSLISITVDESNITYDSRSNCNAIIETATNKLIAGCNTTIIPSSVTSIGSYAFAGCSGLTLIEIPSGVSEIDFYTFYSSGLTSINIPEGVTKIHSGAFLNCINLSYVILPSSVNSIIGSAFLQCTNLSYIKCYRLTPPSLELYMFYGRPFDDITSTCTLYVPSGSLSSYKSDRYWKQFTNIIEFDPEEETQE